MTAEKHIPRGEHVFRHRQWTKSRETKSRGAYDGEKMEYQDFHDPHGLLGRHIKPLIGVYVRRADAHAGLIWEMRLETVVEGLFSGPRRGGIVRVIFEDDPWT